MPASGSHIETCETGRALVPMGPRIEASVMTGSRPCGLFLAQLIAVAQRSPQTRRHRRATPEEARSAYAAAATPAAWLGRALYRST
jgi:hypothetical protein